MAASRVPATLLAVLALAPHPAVGAHAFAAAVAAATVAPLAVMLADTCAPGVRPAVMLANAGAPAVLAGAPDAIMLADAGAPQSLHLLLSGRLCSQMLALPGSPCTCLLIWRLCSQMLAPPQPMQLLLMRLCSQMPAPPQSLAGAPAAGLLARTSCAPSGGALSRCFCLPLSLQHPASACSGPPHRRPVAPPRCRHWHGAPRGTRGTCPAASRALCEPARPTRAAPPSPRYSLCTFATRIVTARPRQDHVLPRPPLA
jgi:hypothetical protein